MSINKVVEKGFCIGCGVCSLIDNNVNINLTEKGFYKADLSNMENTTRTTKVCPFSDESENEDKIGFNLFGSQTNIKKSDYSGYFLSTYIGSVNDSEVRMFGGSGGITTWILEKLLKTKEVDFVIHVKDSNKTGIQYEYSISNSVIGLRSGAKSKYYPITLNSVSDKLSELEGKIAIIGIPCFVKAIRLLQNEDETFKNKIKFVGALFCGHLKSTFYADYLSYQFNLGFSKIQKVDFRKKVVDKRADQYGTEVFYKNHCNETLSKTKDTKQLHGTTWAHGMFKYKACDFCDDITGEVADFSLGDAWLEDYINDYRGTNILIVRNPIINQLINNAILNNELSLSEVDERLVYKSQAGGFRHRREGLAVRQKIEANSWTPLKRQHLIRLPDNRLRIRLYKIRYTISKLSIPVYAYLRQKNLVFLFPYVFKPFFELHKFYQESGIIFRIINMFRR